MHAPRGECSLVDVGCKKCSIFRSCSAGRTGSLLGTCKGSRRSSRGRAHGRTNTENERRKIRRVASRRRRG